jgi:hypothetical protein
MFIFLCLFNINLILIQYNKGIDYTAKESTNIIIIHLKKLTSLWNDSLISFDNLIKENIQNSGEILQKYGLLFIKIFKYKYGYLMPICFEFLPKLLVIVCFLIDIVIYHKFNYFYKVSVLLIIPLIHTYILYSFESFCEINLIDFDHTVKIVELTSNKQITIIDYMFEKARNISDIDKYKYGFGLTDVWLEKHKHHTTNTLNSTLLRYIHVIHDVFLNILLHIYNIKNYKEAYKPYYNLFLYILYLIGWGYIICFGLSLDLKVVLMIIIINIIDKEEPFSGLNI